MAIGAVLVWEGAAFFAEGFASKMNEKLRNHGDGPNVRIV